MFDFMQTVLDKVVARAREGFHVVDGPAVKAPEGTTVVIPLDVAEATVEYLTTEEPPEPSEHSGRVICYEPEYHRSSTHLRLEDGALVVSTQIDHGVCVVLGWELVDGALVATPLLFSDDNITHEAWEHLQELEGAVCDLVGLAIAEVMVERGIQLTAGLPQPPAQVGPGYGEHTRVAILTVRDVMPGGWSALSCSPVSLSMTNPDQGLSLSIVPGYERGSMTVRLQGVDASVIVLVQPYGENSGYVTGVTGGHTPTDEGLRVALTSVLQAFAVFGAYRGIFDMPELAEYEEGWPIAA